VFAALPAVCSSGSALARRTSSTFSRAPSLVHEFTPPGWNGLTVDQQRYRGAIAVSNNDGHAFFYECPNAHRGISLKKLEKLPGYLKQAKLANRHADDDSGITFDDMQVFSIDAALEAISSGENRFFSHPTSIF